jgi:hypothetical protein
MLGNQKASQKKRLLKHQRGIIYSWDKRNWVGGKGHFPVETVETGVRV